MHWVRLPTVAAVVSENRGICMYWHQSIASGVLKWQPAKDGLEFWLAGVVACTRHC